MPEHRRADQSELSEAGAPALPPLWVEMARTVANEWPLPVFLAGLVAVGLFLWVRPEREDLRPWQEYVSDARRAFAMARRAQDEQGKVTEALKFLAVENVPELARARWNELRFGPRSEGGRPRYTRRVHGVLPSYDRAIIRGGQEVLEAADLGMMGEAYYRLARIRQEYPDSAGRSVALDTADLYRRAAQRLAEAEARSPGLEGRDWRRRRRMWAECHAYLGEDSRALEALNELLGKMNVAEASQLRREKDPSADPSSSGRGGDGQEGAAGGGGRDVEEWARIYELLARCHARRGDEDAAARYYRMFLNRAPAGNWPIACG